MTPVEILLSVVGISLLVVVHEAGHYLAARASGMRVTRFSVGFGPALVRYQPKNSPTTFQVCAVPFLAYVQIAGMSHAEDVDRSDPALFVNRGLFARVATIFAGPFANYLAASVLAFGLALWGLPDDVPTEPMVIEEVTIGSAAARGGLLAGDIVREANGVRIRSVLDLRRQTRGRAGSPTEYVVERKPGQIERVVITPTVAATGDAVIGVSAKTERRYVSQPLGQAALYALALPYRITEAQVLGIIQLVRHRSTEGVMGPIGMGKEMAKAARQGVPEYLWFLLVISVALGMFNLLPFPALDGGRLVFLGYEAVTRRRPNERFELVVHTVGLIVLLSMLVLVTFRDVMG